MGTVVDLAFVRRVSNTRWKRAKTQVVLTNGCFDVLTPAHFDLIKFAAAQGDVLIVAVNSDDAVRALKGPNRPINKQADRAYALSQIVGVDYVVIFGSSEDPSVQPIVERIMPDVLVKGGNYRVSEVVGRAFVENQSGRVVISPERPGVSTTATVEALAGEGIDIRTMADARPVMIPARADGPAIGAAIVCYYICKCGAYAVRSWVDPRVISYSCDVCGQTMELVAASRKTCVPVTGAELEALKQRFKGLAITEQQEASHATT